jgi:hypothetical protein
MIEVESTLGGFALAVNESSWPPLAGDVQRRIDSLAVDDATKEVLSFMACGITETQVRMECMYLSAMPHQRKVDPELGALIQEIKRKTPCMNASGAAKSYAVVASLYAVIARAYEAGLRGEGLVPADVFAEVRGVLEADGA